MTEKLFMACNGNTEQAEQYGPFKTAEEAETEAARLGFEWVGIFTHVVDEFGTIMDTKPTRFYQPEGLRLERKPADVEAIRRMLVPAPLNEDEIKFFAQYEEQMSSVPVEEIKKVDWRKDSRMGAIFHRLRKTNG